MTTPIYYVNDVPSIGHAYTTFAADVVARYRRLKGDKVFFLTGLDENSQKTVQAAKKFGAKDVKKYADEMALKWLNAWRVLGVSNDGFIRTTEEKHRKTVNEFFLKVWEKGDVYKGKYEGLYCEGCEAFVNESDLVEGNCPFHLKPPKSIVEENYFFKLSKYEKKLLQHIQEHPEFIQPEKRRNEVVSFIKAGLKDISISRPDVDWGIPLPVDDKHKFWVWFDALLNYVSGSEGNWPADLHLMAKDIIKFHCIIWPAMLLSAGYELPKKIVAHGFLTINGQKMSKSLGNAVDPIALTQKYGVDALRYFLFREISFGEDGDFTEKALKERHDNELVNSYANFAYRVLSFIATKNNSIIPKPSDYSKEDEEFDKEIEALAEKVGGKIEAVELKQALDEAMEFCGKANKYFNDKAPWKLLKEERREETDTTLFLSAKACFAASLALTPFIPTTTQKVFVDCLNIKPKKWGDYAAVKPLLEIRKPEIVLKKIGEK